MATERISSRARIERAFREFCRAVAGKHELSNADVKRLLGDQLQVGANDTYYLDETGISRVSVSDIEQRKLFDLEVVALWEVGNDARLDFPCTHERFAEWLGGNSSFSAPDDYLRARAAHRHEERKEIERRERSAAAAAETAAARERAARRADADAREAGMIEVIGRAVREAATAESKEREATEIRIREEERTRLERVSREAAAAESAATKIRLHRGGQARSAEIERLVDEMLSMRPGWRKDQMPGVRRDLAQALRILSPGILSELKDPTLFDYFKRMGIKFRSGGKSKQFLGYTTVLNEITKKN